MASFGFAAALLLLLALLIAPGGRDTGSGPSAPDWRATALNSDPTGSASAVERLTIRRSGSRIFASFRLRAKVEVRARILLRLYGIRPYPEARWRPLHRWELVRTLRSGGRYELHVRARHPWQTCRSFAGCRLQATATTWSRGKRLARRRARRPVATGVWEPDLAAAGRYASHRPGDVSFAIVDLRSRLRGLHESRTAPAASVIKAMLLAAYLRQHSVRGRGLRGEEKALLEPMIRSSDNAAGIQVAALVGGDAIERLARAAHMRDFQLVWEPGWLGGLSQISARDQAAFFHRFHRHLPKRHRRYARGLLASIISWQRWGIGQERPRGWRLYLKGGWGINDDGIGTVNHQVAFLERGRCRIALAILTEHDPSPADGIETLRGVSKRLLRGIRGAPCGGSPGRTMGPSRSGRFLAIPQAGASIFGNSGGTRSTFCPPGREPSPVSSRDSSPNAASRRSEVCGR